MNANSWSLRKRKEDSKIDLHSPVAKQCALQCAILKAAHAKAYAETEKEGTETIISQTTVIPVMDELNVHFQYRSLSFSAIIEVTFVGLKWNKSQT